MQCTNKALGPPCLDDLSGRSGALQNAACGIPEDWPGMGNPWRSWSAIASQGGGKRGVPAGIGLASVFDQAVGEVAGHVRGGRGFDTYAASSDTCRCVSAR